MPHQFLIKSVEDHQSSLLESGYGCAVFSEIDEFIVADPGVFKGGLEEYLNNFLENTSLQSSRTEGRDVIQIETDSPMNWSANILSQRRHWGLSPHFSKTLITKVSLHYTPGFHHLQLKADPKVTPTLKLAHLHFADLNYCLIRENLKHKESKNMHPDEVGRFGVHFSTRFELLQGKPGGVCNASNLRVDFHPEEMDGRWTEVFI
jgi:hypothetical protein